MFGLRVSRRRRGHFFHFPPRPAEQQQLGLLQLIYSSPRMFGLRVSRGRRGHFPSFLSKTAPRPAEQQQLGLLQLIYSSPRMFGQGESRPPGAFSFIFK